MDKYNQPGEKMRILILGANSDVAHSLSRKFAKTEKADFYLASRNKELLEKKAVDLTSRYSVSAETVYFDAQDYDSHREFYKSLDPSPDGVIVAFGYTGEQDKAQSDFNETKKVIDSNYTGAVSILEIIATDFEIQKKGFIIGISSVAGDRGRMSNYIYGSAKAGFSTYLSGLRNRLSSVKVPVLTVLPGFINTKMTEQLDLPPMLTAEPSEVADDIYKAFKKGKNIIYTKWYWKVIMKIIKLIPEFLFKRLSM